MKHLVVFDVPSIKDYVFGTDRLVEIRGASALLDHLNRIGTERFLKTALGDTAVDLVFAGGGASQFLLNGDEGRIDDVIEELKGCFVKESRGGLRLVSGRAEMVRGQYRESLASAFMRMKQEKEENPFRSTPAMHSGLIRECDSCSGMATTVEEHAGDEVILCDTCHRKLDFGRTNKGLWRGFEEFLDSRGANDTFERPTTFEEIGSSSKKAGYLALVYADGNHMGKIIRSIDDRKQFAFFSQTIDTCIREACHEALAESLAIPAVRADILLLGGDDLLVCLSADAAFPFAISVADKFHEKTKARFGRSGLAPVGTREEGVTLSLGIAFGKSHTPFFVLLEQAEELLRSAKRGGSCDVTANDSYVPSYIDFHDTSQFNQVHVHDSRERFLTRRHVRHELHFHCRPYSLDQAHKLLQHAAAIVASDLPRSRTIRLRQAPFLGKMNGTIECLKLIGRVKEKGQRQVLLDALNELDCLTSLPWRDLEGTVCSTALVDLIELTELMR
ncbi:MAG: hypothetical protein HYX75_20990 [Acidobacteria bacterium]|nr:hypothetical protein [Acidobacteriota bacterium]